MGLEELRKEILHKTHEEVRRIEAEAEAEEGRIIGEAESRRKALLEKAKSDAAETIEAERGEHISSARLRAHKLQAEEKEELVEKAIALVRKRFLALPKEKEKYSLLLHKLIEKGVAAVGQGAVVHLNNADRKQVKAIKNATLSHEPASIAGGAIIESPDGRVIVRASLEDLFDEYSGETRRLAYTSLFGKGGK